MAETSTIFGFMKYVSATDILSDFKKTVDSHFVNSLRKQVCFLLCIWVCLNCLECYNLCNRTENIYVRNWNSST